MPDEPKNPVGDSKPEAPKGIEDVLKELPKISASPPPPSKPLLPMPPRPQTPPPALPVKPALPEKTSSPLPAPSQNQPPPSTDKFQSFVRTMESDLEAAKKGLKPESKPFEIKPPPPGPPPRPFTPPAGVKPPTQPLKLGPAEKAKPLETPKSLMPGKPFLPPTGPKPLVGTPGPRKGFPINFRLLIIILVILAAFAGIWFFMTREQEAPPVVFTPTPTATPTPIPKTLSELFPSSDQINISSTENFPAVLSSKIKSLTPVAGSFTILEVFDENQNIYTLSDFIARLNVPAGGILDTLDSSGASLLLYGQQEMFDQKGTLTFNQVPEVKIVLIAKSISPASTRNALNSWEITMTDDLKTLFSLDPQKATSETFLDNAYLGHSIKYRNFPYADRSIDYTIVELPQFNISYFVLTNSRESIYSAIDLLQNQ